MIRTINLEDASAIAAIYNYYIKETVVTFEEDLINEAEVKNRIEKVTQKFPWIVFEKDGEILGYAYANTWRERIAYRFSVEVSVYLNHEIRGKGIGQQLYSHLLETLKKEGYQQILGGITLPNSESEKFHEKFGFKKASHYKKVGFKFDQWHDVGFYQLDFSDNN